MRLVHLARAARARQESEARAGDEGALEAGEPEPAAEMVPPEPEPELEPPRPMTGIERAMLDRYVAATGKGEAFTRAYWALAAQRNTRILGVFTRLWKRDNKPHYTQFQPRMWGLLERDLAQPGLEPVREWFDANVGPDYRVAPWKQAA